MYWHTRSSPASTARNTPNRTIVCYKDSWESAKIDPGRGLADVARPGVRAHANGSRPENALTGTLYMSNFTDLAITVSAREGKIAALAGHVARQPAAGATATLAPHTVGYESDEDLDNGFRPAGLMRLSDDDRADPAERPGPRPAPSWHPARRRTT